MNQANNLIFFKKLYELTQQVKSIAEQIGALHDCAALHPEAI